MLLAIIRCPKSRARVIDGMSEPVMLKYVLSEFIVALKKPLPTPITVEHQRATPPGLRQYPI